MVRGSATSGSFVSLLWFPPLKLTATMAYKVHKEVVSYKESELANLKHKRKKLNLCVRIGLPEALKSLFAELLCHNRILEKMTVFLFASKVSLG